jgi:hypothetical protein
MGRQRIDDGAGCESTQHARHADFAGPPVHAHLHELRTEGVGRNILAAGAAGHRQLALIELRDRFRLQPFWNILGIGFQRPAAEALAGSANFSVTPSVEQKLSVRQSDASGRVPGEGAFIGGYRSANQPVLQFVASLGDGVHDCRRVA